jgi:alpha-tubulin suppressor-like RCC1 family protein
MYRLPIGRLSRRSYPVVAALCLAGIACTGACGKTLPLGATAASLDAGDAFGGAGAVVSICAGEAFTCAAMAAGDVRCWGDNTNGVLGVPPAMVPRSPLAVVVPGLPHDVVDVVCADLAVCARRASGVVLCWGNNGFGTVGDNGSQDASEIQLPTELPLANVTALAAEAADMCALDASGSVSCWGQDVDGEVGDGTLKPDDRTPTRTVGVTNALAVAGGAGFACATRTDRTAACWGADTRGELGDVGAAGSAASTPIALVGVSGIRQIALTSFAGCALLEDGSVSCWGDNSRGQLGRGTSSGSLFPPAWVPGLSDVVSVGTGGAVVCAVRMDRRTFCWGGNADGELGLGIVEDPVSTPTELLTLPDALLVAGGLSHTCAMTVDHETWCWGANDKGQLGIGSVGVSISTPTKVVFSQ